MPLIPRYAPGESVSKPSVITTTLNLPAVVVAADEVPLSPLVLLRTLFGLYLCEQGHVTPMKLELHIKIKAKSKSTILHSLFYHVNE